MLHPQRGNGDVVEELERDLHAFGRQRSNSPLKQFVEEWPENDGTEVDLLVDGAVAGKNVKVRCAGLRQKVEHLDEQATVEDDLESSGAET